MATASRSNRFRNASLTTSSCMYNPSMHERFLMFAALLAFGACKSNGDTATSKPEQQCAQLAKTCADTDKHVEKLRDECKQSITPTCTAKQTALYDCYEKQLCGKADRIWALQDLSVLAERKNLCIDERKAVSACK